MPDQIYIGNFAKGLTTNILPFNIDNDAFPYVYNMYLWRGRAKRKRGTVFLGQLKIQVQMVTSAPLSWQLTGPSLSGGSVNLFSSFTIGAQGGIASGSVSFVVGANTYTDANGTGVLTGAPSGTGTINYSTGVVTISGGGSTQITGTWSYYPALPVMGLRDYLPNPSSGSTINPYPLLLSFDTQKSYQFNQTTNSFYNVSFYKYSNKPVIWSGQNYQQFWTTNYESAFWATNNKPGLIFKAISAITAGSPTIITTGSPHNLTTGDYVWFNEITGSDAGTLNGHSFAVTVTGATTFTVAVDTSMMTINGDGIFQYLTANPASQGDGIRWYDGDPTNSTGLPTTSSSGWINFAPPLTATTVNINNLPAALYYLVGAQMIVPFKDRLLFFSPWVQTSGGTAISLQDTVIWSQNGTPYYSVAPNSPSAPGVDVTAFYVDVTGKGGYLAAGTQQSIVSVTDNEDVLLVAFTGGQTRFVFTGNDFNPFLFFSINSELGASSTFSGINLDRGGLTLGTYGIALTTQQSSQRIDLEIPDQVFQVQASNNGALRVNAARDFFKEWIYFSYPVNNSQWSFPTQSLLYNYRDNTWAVLYENFTAHGQFRRTSSYIWSNLPFSTWAQWSEGWDSGSTSSQFPSIVGGNPQGYVLIKAQGTGESISGTIQTLATSSGGLYTQITSVNHCVRVGDYLYITGCLGTTGINNQVGRVNSIVDTNNFVIDLAFPAGTYLGLGRFSRLSQPLLQTKQFNFYWEQGRQVRLGVQKYLLDRTQNGQITLQIYLSQDPDNAWNDSSIVPSSNPDPVNSSLEYSDIIFTCPETDNLQSPTAASQFQIWHRMNTSLIGDSVQIGFTLSDAQMRSLELATSEIALHGVQLSVTPGPLLS